MPLIILLLIALLIAQIGFWNTLAAILGAVGMIVLLIVIAVGIVAVGGVLLARNLSRRIDSTRRDF